MSDLIKPSSQVKIKTNDIKGVVLAASVRGSNASDIEYQISYWVNGERKIEWVSDFEIEVYKDNKRQAGFKTYPPNNKKIIDRI